MILAIDGGLGTFGWAAVRPRTGVVVALGELHQLPRTREGVHADRLRRLHQQAILLHGLVTAYGVTMIVAEEPSFAKPTPAVVASAMGCWGVVLGVAAAHVLPMPSRVAPKAWQRAVLNIDGGACDYAIVEQKLAAYVVGEARDRLLAIPRSRRNHPLDAVGIGVYAALA